MNTGSYFLMDGNVLDILPLLEPNSFDSCFCDPPYGLKFMGKSWDHGVPSVEIWREVYRVLKPGAFLMAFGGTRTYHRLTCAIEDAGFEIRDCLMWLHGQGFPKSLDISKAIDKELGAEREQVLIQTKQGNSERLGQGEQGSTYGDSHGGFRDVSNPITDQAQRWQGYSSALKPAWEPIILAMKPCEGTFAQNALTYGVAGLNIDGGRITYEIGGNAASNPGERLARGSRQSHSKGFWSDNSESMDIMPSALGRWPANLLLSHHPTCQEVGTRKVKSGTHVGRNLDVSTVRRENPSVYSAYKRDPLDKGYAGADGLEEVADFDCHPLCPVRLLDEQSGGASRFFYTAKVSTSERNLGNIDCRHPTLKPISLCSYLSTLLLPPSHDSNPRRLIVPFSGAGSEMIGALLAGWDEVHGIEIDPQYLTWAEARISAAMRGEVRGEAPSKEGNQDDNQEGRQDRRKGRGRTPTLSTEALDVLGDILS